jgi:phosphoribosylanthranilate isomerase
MPLSVKICGLTTKEAVNAAVEYGADYLGFIFYPLSPRNISPEQAFKLTSHLPGNVKKVAVMVDPEPEEIEEIVNTFHPTYVQLHGQELPIRVTRVKKRFGLPIIKAIGVHNADDLQLVEAYYGAADMLLLDAKPDNSWQAGGTGKPFNWKLLRKWQPVLPWFLSGGLSIDNIEEAISTSHAQLIDVSSSLESKKGIKDPQMIKEFLQEIHSLS